MNKINQSGQNVPIKKPKIEFVVEQPIGLLDFLLNKLSHQSRNKVKALLAHKEIYVDGTVTTKYDYPLRAGQTITIKRTGKPLKNQQQNRKSVLDIIYEDKDIIVINKPAGLLSIANEKEKELTAYHLLTDYVRESNMKSRVYVVHRLDRDTSGVLMIAKNEKIKLAFQENWETLVSKRGYVAIVEGQLKEKSGRIQSWLLETKTHLMYSSGTEGDGQESITNYQVIKENKQYSLLDIHLETGRKNQIRVHMKDIGHSIVGDKNYGASSNPLKRLGLHAHILEIKHPFTNEIMCFETKIPSSFMSLLNKSRVN